MCEKSSSCKSKFTVWYGWIVLDRYAGNLNLAVWVSKLRYVKDSKLGVFYSYKLESVPELGQK